MPRVKRSAPALAPFPVPDMPGQPRSFFPACRFLRPPGVLPSATVQERRPISRPGPGQISRQAFASGLKIPARLQAREP